MTTYLESLLAEKFRKAVSDPKLAASLAALACGTLKAIDLVPRHSMDSFEMDAKINILRNQHVTECEITERLGICKRRIYLALVRHAKRRRAALKVNSEPESLEQAG